MTDDRKWQRSLTMTMEEWDALRGRAYVSWRVESAARDKLKELTDPGYEERRQGAHYEARASLPILTDPIKRAVREEVRRLIYEFRAGRLKVDHLGHPATHIGGFAVSLTPRLHGGGSAIQFRFATEVWMEHSPLALGPDDRQWVIDTVVGIAEITDPHVWNKDGPYVNVRFQ